MICCTLITLCLYNIHLVHLFESSPPASWQHFPLQEFFLIIFYVLYVGTNTKSLNCSDFVFILYLLYWARQWLIWSSLDFLISCYPEANQHSMEVESGKNAVSNQINNQHGNIAARPSLNLEEITPILTGNGCLTKIQTQTRLGVTLIVERGGVVHN